MLYKNTATSCNIRKSVNPSKIFGGVSYVTTYLHVLGFKFYPKYSFSACTIYWILCTRFNQLPLILLLIRLRSEDLKHLNKGTGYPKYKVSIHFTGITGFLYEINSSGIFRFCFVTLCSLVFFFTKLRKKKLRNTGWPCTPFTITVSRAFASSKNHNFILLFNYGKFTPPSKTGFSDWIP